MSLEILQYVCDIIKHEMSLDGNQVCIYSQHYKLPTFNTLLVSAGLVSAKAIGNSSYTAELSGVLHEFQKVNMQALLGVDIWSRDDSALERKEEIILALGSVYAQQRQEKYSFSIGKIPQGFVNLSEVDGAKIPYRFNLSFQTLYSVVKNKQVDYFENFEYEVTEED